MLGKTLNHRYLLEQVLSRAPSGILYLATDEQSGELLAVKVFSPAPGKADEGLLRYRRAMNRLAGAEHPHLLLPLWTGESDGAFFQVLPYFPASSLGELLSGGPLPLKEGVSLLRQGASALASIHGAGISHLNLKPSNLLVSREDGNLHLVMTDPARAFLREGELVPARVEDLHYYAPEQLPWGKPQPDQRSDLYALGMIAYQALTGALPFTAGTARELMRHHLVTPPPSPRQHNEDIPPALESILLRLLAKDPALRWQKAEHLLSALERWNATESPESADSGAGGSPSRIPNPNYAGSGLAGRESARERLRTALAGAASGKGSLVLLQGEPGAGRGALVADLRTAVEGARGLLLEACPPGEDGCPPYALPLRLLHGLLGEWETLPDLQRRDLLARLHMAAGEQVEVLTELLPALAPLLPEDEGQATLPMGRDWMRTLGVLTAAFRAIGEPRHPLVLFLRELQWADADSLEWLGRLIQGIGETSLLIVASVTTGTTGTTGTPETTRLEEMLHPWLETLQSGEDVHWIEVPPLSVEQCALQLERLTGTRKTAIRPASRNGCTDAGADGPSPTRWLCACCAPRECCALPPPQRTWKAALWETSPPGILPRKTSPQEISPPTGPPWTGRRWKKPPGRNPFPAWCSTIWNCCPKRCCWFCRQPLFSPRASPSPPWPGCWSNIPCPCCWNGWNRPSPPVCWNAPGKDLPSPTFPCGRSCAATRLPNTWRNCTGCAEPCWKRRPPRLAAAWGTTTWRTGAWRTPGMRSTRQGRT